VLDGGPKTDKRGWGSVRGVLQKPVRPMVMVCRVMRNHRILWRDAHRAPLGGGLVKAEWFKRYRENERPERFDRIVQSWDTANKATELSDFSVCTTWGVKGKDLFRLVYPLRYLVREPVGLGSSYGRSQPEARARIIERCAPTWRKVRSSHAWRSLSTNSLRPSVIQLTI
jgi:hypothetical protein